MACKIEISQNLHNEVSKKAIGIDSMRFDIAVSKAKQINNEYKHKVVEVFRTANEYFHNVIVNIPSALIEEYYKFFSARERKEAEDVQREDALRSETEYTDDYMFQLEEKPVIKEGVPELFEKKEKNVNITITQSPTIEEPIIRVEISTPESNGHASVNVKEEDKSAYISDIQIGDFTDESRGKGYGMQVYIQIGKTLKKLGYILESTQWNKHLSAISPAALRVWEKLAEIGYAQVVGKTQNKVYNRETGEEKIVETNIYKFTEKQELATNKPPLSIPAKNTERIKEAAAKMGIKIKDLLEYAKESKLDVTGINGIADIVKKVVAIAQGMEDTALTEEVVHIATAMLEQTNPKLITELISKIDKFAIYKQTYDAYSKIYTLSNGKPDIRKIKKEAVDKLLTEVILNDSADLMNFPELMRRENINMVKQWWNTIKDYIRGIYRKSDIDIFEEVGRQILSGNIQGETKGEGTYFQIAGNPLVDSLYNKVIDISNRTELVPESVNDKRHYIFDGRKVAKSVTEFLKEKTNKFLANRTDEQKAVDEQKKEWGTVGHAFLEQYITANLIDKNGYRNATFLDVPISTTLSEKIQKEIKAFARELIMSYSSETRFIIERKVVNESVKGLLASTIDFMAIEPILTKEGKKDIKVDILDWKFSTINKSTQEDIASKKRKEWIAQMGEYTKILYNYGLKPAQLRKARMIPFIVNYENIVTGDSKSGIQPKSLEIGKLNSLTETNLYLLPVPINSETTGNTKIDNLLTALREQLEKLYKQSVAPEDEFAKKLRLQQMNKAIRHLHLKLDFEPLVNVGKTFLNNVAKTFEEFKNIDYSKLTKQEIEKRLGDLLSIEESALKYSFLDDVYLSHISKENMSKEDKTIFLSLEQISSATNRMLEKIKDMQRQYTIQLELIEGIAVKGEESSILKAEVAISGFAKTFLEGSKLSSKIISLASNLIMRADSMVSRAISREISEFEKILLPLEKEAKTKGKKAFDLIGTMSETGLHLIKKIDGKFWEDIREAKEKKNKKFLIQNMDMIEYARLVEETKSKIEKELDDIQFSSEEEKDNEIRNYRKRALRDSLDVTRDTFNGYNDYNFNNIFLKVLKEEGHYSKEYLAMSEESKKVWAFFVSLNRRAKNVGYLEKQGSSFFPLIEATTLEKFSQTSNVGMQIKDFFADLYSVRINEEQQYSKIDEETGKIKRVIPKYFTRTDKRVDQLSRDLNKVGSLWIKSILEYENSRNIENTLLTLHAVEQAKGSLIIGPDGKVIFENGLPKVDEANNKNADILQVIIDDYIYKLSEDLSSLGNLNLNTLLSKTVKDQENVDKSVVSIKKGIKNADTLVRALAVGLKPLIGFANWAGGQFQSFIQAGNMYRFREFTRNNIRVTVGNLSTIERGILDLIMPLNEDVSLEKRREMAKKNSFLDYLGTWSFTDVMMVTNSAPERRLQYANAMSFNENSMVVNGKIVNIRQYLKKQDRKAKESLAEIDRIALEKSYEQRVKELKESSNLLKIAVIENGDVVIPGVSEEELAKYRVKIIEYGRTLNGQMNMVNKAGYRRDTIFSSFMMFKTWIPKLVSVRALDIKKNIELDEWEYGRTRAFLKTIVFLSFKNISQLRDIINGTDEGLKILDELLEAKKAEHFKQTGQILEITNEEFYDLMRTQITNQLKELKLLVGVLGLVIAAKAAEPPEDASLLERNRYKFWAKAINKVSDELTFYYDPRSMDSITKGSIVPSLGLLVKVEQLLVHLTRETKGYILNDDKMMDKAYPLKYFFNIIPGAAQFQTELLPYLNPELAKEMGIRLTSQARR